MVAVSEELSPFSRCIRGPISPLAIESHAIIFGRNTQSMDTSAAILSSWPGNPTPGSTLLLLSIWFGPAVLSALAASWLSGRRGGGVGKGVAVGIAGAFVGGMFGCAVPPAMVAAPLIGAAAAVVAVLSSE